MENFLTPKPKARHRGKFATPTSSYKSPLLNKVVEKVKFDPMEASLEELKQKTLELREKNEAIKKEIKSLKNKGYEEDQLQWYIDNLHEYNNIKDLAQRLLGDIAISKNTTCRKIHEEFGMTDSD